MPNIVVNDTQLYYLQDGAGEDVILVHGLASNLAFWYSGIMVPLRRRYRVTAYDLRGHGKSAMPESGYTHFAMADDLAVLAETLHVSRFHLIGHSYGGLVALTYAQNHPERVLSLTLADVPIDTPAELGQSFTENSNDKYPELDLLEQLAKNPVKAKSAETPFIPFQGGKGSGRTAKLWLKLLETTSARTDFRTRKISLRELRTLQVPTLLTYGGNSAWRYSGKLLKETLPDTNFLAIENAGHSHPWEKPGVFLRSWFEFVQGLGQRPSPDRRYNLRHRVELPLELHDKDGRHWPVCTINVSTSGILLISPFPCKAGVPVHLLQQKDQQQWIATGHVVRCDQVDATYFLAIQYNDPETSSNFTSHFQEMVNKTSLSALID